MFDILGELGVCGVCSVSTMCRVWRLESAAHPSVSASVV